MNTQTILQDLKERYPHQPTFLQTAEEILDSIAPYLESNEAGEEDYRLLARLVTPERIISFRVDWVDDRGILQTNTGYRVQFNSALGPYKGGLRFDPSVNEDILKFLGLEQIFKNALTGLPLGGGKGGSDFNPKGKSDNEIRNFCRAFMRELHRYIGLEVDVPAGDIGVGGREIGYMYGMYKQLVSNANAGAITGKDPLIGGSLGRTEATGYGVVYFAEAMAKHHGLELAGLAVAVSGSGNVAEYVARKLLYKGAIVLTLSDRGGYLYKESGLTVEDITHIAKEKDDGKSLKDISIDGAEYGEGKVWQVEADAYFPCATQNEVAKEDAESMIKSAKLIVEGANMPLTAEALEIVRGSGVLYAPGKASNAGGVSVSGLEMAQNAAHYHWTAERVDEELQKIMQNIHTQCVENGQKETGAVDYVNGANIAGFRRVFDAMRKLGW